MTRAASRSWTVTLALVLAASALAGCPTKQQLDAMPGLADVTPTVPHGHKCYEFCAESDVECKHMCPHTIGPCHEDCVADTKLCLADCPELLRPEPKSK